MTERPPRRARLRVRLELGLAAFCPAFVLLAVRTRHNSLAWLFVVPAAAGLLVLVYGMVVVATGNAERFTFGPIDDLGGEILGHVGAYLLPLIVGPGSSTEDILTTAIIMALILHIHVATGRVLVNPLLYLLGRRVLQRHGRRRGVLPRRRVRRQPVDHGRAVRADRRERARREAGAGERSEAMVTTAKVIEATRAHVAEAVGLLVARLADDGRVEGAKLHLSDNVADSFRGYCLGALGLAGDGDGAGLQRRCRARFQLLLPHRRHGDPRRTVGDRRPACGDRDAAAHPPRPARPDDPAVRRRRRQRRRPRAVRATHQPAADPRRRQEVPRRRRRAPDATRRASFQLRPEVRLPRRRPLGDRPRPAVLRDAVPGDRDGRRQHHAMDRWHHRPPADGRPPTSSHCGPWPCTTRGPGASCARSSSAVTSPRSPSNRSSATPPSSASIQRPSSTGGRLTFDPAQRFSFLHLLNEDLYKGQLTDELFEAQRKARASPQ